VLFLPSSIKRPSVLHPHVYSLADALIDPE